MSEGIKSSIISPTGSGGGGGSGDVNGPAIAVDGQAVVFDGTSGKLIKANVDTGVAHLTAGVLSASDVDLTSEVTGVLPEANGGTNQSTYAQGDILYASAANTLSKRTIGAANTVLSSNGTVPNYALLVNANIDAAAAIAYSKLNLSNSIVNADVNASAAIAYSKLNLSNSIVNADINASAAIALNKLAALTANRATETDASGFIVASTVTNTELGYVSGVTSSIQTQLNGKEPTLTKGNLTEAVSSILTITGGTNAVIGAGTTIEVDQADSTNDGFLSSTDWNTFNNKQDAGNYITALTGDVTATGPGSVAGTIANDAVTNTKLANMATQTFKGRTTAGTGDPEDLTATQATAILDTFTTTLKGLVPPPTTVTGKYLDDSGAWTVPTGSADQSYELSNLGLSVVASSDDLIINLVTKSGSTPSVGSPVLIGFRDETITDGLYYQRSVTGAVNLTITQSSDLGVYLTGVDFYVNIYAIDNAGTVELAASISRFDEGLLHDTTAEGGLGGADSNALLYSTTARTGVAVRFLGRAKCSFSTIGDWTTPTEVSINPFDKKDLSCFVWQDSAQINFSNATYTKMTFNTVDFDTNFCWNNSNDRFVVTEAGRYEIVSQLRLDGGAGVPNETQIAIYKNGSLFLQQNKFVSINGDNINCQGTLDLVVSDYIEIWMQNNSGANRTTASTNTRDSSLYVIKV